MISFVITCYNLGEYLEQCVDSIFNIKGKNEVILVNDGSTDDFTLEAIRHTKKRYPELIIVNQFNAGVGAARNVGAKLATKDWILFVDADNYLAQDIYETFESCLKNSDKFDVLYGNAQFFGLKNEIWPQKKFDPLELIRNNYIDTCSFVKKSTFDEVGGFDENREISGFEDWDFWLRIHRSNGRFVFVDKIIFHYRCREHSLLSSNYHRKKSIEEIIFSKKELLLFRHIRKLEFTLDEIKRKKDRYSVRLVKRVFRLKSK